MKKKIIVLCLALILVLANNLSATNVSAESTIDALTVEDSVMSVNQLINQSQIVEENLIEVTDGVKQELILELSKELKKNANYNVGIAQDSNASDFTILGMKLPNGEIQYSVSSSSINTNNEGIVNDLELLNFTFNDKIKLTNIFELKGALDADNNVHSNLWIDNKLVTSLEKNIDELINGIEAEKVGNDIAEEQMIGNASIKEQEFSGAGLAKRWSCTQSCVSSKGVSLMVIGVMAGVCIAVCNPAALAASAGLSGGACYACVNSTGVLGFSTVMKCWNKCPY